MGLFQIVVATGRAAARAASSSPSSPREERVGRGPRRGETNKNAPPLPSPLLHPMEEREKSRSLTQPCREGAFQQPGGRYEKTGQNSIRTAGRWSRQRQRQLF